MMDEIEQITRAHQRHVNRINKGLKGSCSLADLWGAVLVGEALNHAKRKLAADYVRRQLQELTAEQVAAEDDRETIGV
jgi:hypothetical protein